MLLLNISVIWSISFDEVQYWVGEGSDQALVLMDWQDDSPALVWGYRFTAMTTGREMLEAIVDADERLNYNGASFINDLDFSEDNELTHVGHHADPNYWSLHLADLNNQEFSWSHFGGLSFTINRWLKFLVALME